MIDTIEKIRKVELLPHDAQWASLFCRAAAEIKPILQDNCIAVHHIGSTSIPNIYAKPIIDVLVVVKEISKVDPLNNQFETLGYRCMGEYGISGRRYYWKSKEKHTHHLHLFQQGSAEIQRHLLFRDFLMNHPDDANAYSILKCCLADVFPNDIENYVNGKTSFIEMIKYKAGVANPVQLAAEDNIVIESYHAAWPKLADAEINAIKRIAANLSYAAIEHLGSTAVPGLSSKPIIDIFISVDSMQTAKQWIYPLETLGYHYWQDNPDKTHLRFFKGMPPFGTKRTHHIHLVESTNSMFEQRVLFRDILRTDKNIRDNYERLKQNLSKNFRNDREAYTDNKTEFIKSVLQH